MLFSPQSRPAFKMPLLLRKNIFHELLIGNFSRSMKRDSARWSRVCLAEFALGQGCPTILRNHLIHQLGFSHQSILIEQTPKHAINEGNKLAR
jgi:hypothetical protein